MRRASLRALNLLQGWPITASQLTATVAVENTALCTGRLLSSSALPQRAAAEAQPSNEAAAAVEPSIIKAPPTKRQKIRQTSATVPTAAKNNNNSISPISTTRRILEDSDFAFHPEQLSPQVWKALTRLREGGHETLICGGTPRDILLNTPFKDVDIVTSAEPRQIKSLFKKAIAVGRRFPVTHVFIDSALIEVSSFSTNSDTILPGDSASIMKQLSNSSISSLDKSKKKKKKNKQHTKKQSKDDGGVDTPPPATNQQQQQLSTAVTWSAARQSNARSRDFTVNGLLLDPFSRLLYDYVGGVNDCNNRILKTISNPIDSFSEDPARILRAIRLAARVKLDICEETAQAMHDLGPKSVVTLPLGRLEMELNALMSHGAAARSIELLHKFVLLSVLLPHHAALLMDSQQLLYRLLEELDKHVHPQKPISQVAWLTLLAAPIIAHECSIKRGIHRAELQQQLPTVSTDTNDADSNATEASVAEYSNIARAVIDRLVSAPQAEIMNKLQSPAVPASLLSRSQGERALDVLLLEVSLRGKKVPRVLKFKKTKDGKTMKLSEDGALVLQILRKKEFAWAQRTLLLATAATP